MSTIERARLVVNLRIIATMRWTLAIGFFFCPSRFLIKT